MLSNTVQVLPSFQGRNIWVLTFLKSAKLCDLECECCGQLNRSLYPCTNICGACSWTSLSTLGRDNSREFLQILTRRPCKVGHQGIVDFSRHLFGFFAKITEGIAVWKKAERVRNSVWYIHGHPCTHWDYTGFFLLNDVVVGAFVSVPSWIICAYCLSHFPLPLLRWRPENLFVKDFIGAKCLSRANFGNEIGENHCSAM